MIGGHHRVVLLEVLLHRDGALGSHGKLRVPLQYAPDERADGARERHVKLLEHELHRKLLFGRRRLGVDVQQGVPEHVVQQRGRARIEPHAQVGDRGEPDAVDVVEGAGWTRLARREQRVALDVPVFPHRIGPHHRQPEAGGVARQRQPAHLGPPALADARERQGGGRVQRRRGRAPGPPPQLEPVPQRAFAHARPHAHLAAGGGHAQHAQQIAVAVARILAHPGHQPRPRQPERAQAGQPGRQLPFGAQRIAADRPAGQRRHRQHAVGHRPDPQRRRDAAPAHRLDEEPFRVLDHRAGEQRPAARRQRGHHLLQEGSPGGRPQHAVHQGGVQLLAAFGPRHVSHGLPIEPQHGGHHPAVAARPIQGRRLLDPKALFSVGIVDRIARRAIGGVVGGRALLHQGQAARVVVRLEQAGQRPAAVGRPHRGLDPEHQQPGEARRPHRHLHRHPRRSGRLEVHRPAQLRLDVGQTHGRGGVLLGRGADRQGQRLLDGRAHHPHGASRHPAGSR